MVVVFCGMTQLQTSIIFYHYLSFFFRLKMWQTVLSLLAVICTASAACPAAWLPDGANTWCYGLLTVQAYNSSYTARQACLAIGADLIRLKDLEAHQKAGELLAGTSVSLSQFGLQQILK